MTRWMVEFTRDGENDLVRLDAAIRERIVEKIEWMAESLDVLVSIPLNW